MKEIQNSRQSIYAGSHWTIWDMFKPSESTPHKDVLDVIDKCEGPYALNRKNDREYVFTCFAANPPRLRYQAELPPQAPKETLPPSIDKLEG